MGRKQNRYDKEYKIQAVKLSKEIGGAKAAAELGIPEDTLYGWHRAVREGRLEAGAGMRTPQDKSGGRSGGPAQAGTGAGERTAAAEGRERDIGGSLRIFRREPSEIRKEQRMKFIALKTGDGASKGKVSLYCRTLEVSRQGFYKYLANRERAWKYQALADSMLEILGEDEYNDTYGRTRMHQALLFRWPEGVHIPSERTVYRVMEKLGIRHRPKRKPNSITKEEREAQKSDDLLKRDFSADEPLKKCVTDITEIKARDGKLDVSAIFDCFDLTVLGLSMDTNMKADLCRQTLSSAVAAYPELRGAIVHSDRGSQYTSGLYRQAIALYGIRQEHEQCRGPLPRQRSLREYVGQNEVRTPLRPV